MKSIAHLSDGRPSRHWLAAFLATGSIVAVTISATLGTPTASAADQPGVGLGTATSFAVLAGSTVTNINPTLISGDLGVSPGTAITGDPLVVNGTVHRADDVAAQAQLDLVTAYDDAAARVPTTEVLATLGGRTLLPGVYKATSTLDLTGTVTLDGGNNPAAVFIFQVGSALITAPNSTVALIGEAQPCNVFWQVTSSATLDTNTTFVGTVMALTDVEVLTGSTVSGRAMARNGQVTLDKNRITRTACATPAATTTTTQESTGTTGGSTSTTSGSTSTTGASTGTTGGSTSTPSTEPSGSGDATTTTGQTTSGVAGVTVSTGGTGDRRPAIVNPDVAPATQTLPRTGAPIRSTLLLAALALALGGLIIGFGGREPPPRR